MWTRIAHPHRPSGRRLPSPCARTSLPSGCAASTQPGASVPCVCLCLSPIASHQVERGMLSGRYLYRPGGPPPTPTHALGSRPSHDRFAVSASRSASRNPSTPDFSDVLHEHPPLHLLDSSLCSPARPPLWAPCPIWASPDGKGCAVPCVAELRPGDALAAWRILGRAG